MIKWASGCRVLLIELRPTRRPKETAAGQVHLKLLQSPWQRPNGTENGRRLRSNNPRGRRFIGRQWWHDGKGMWTDDPEKPSKYSNILLPISLSGFRVLGFLSSCIFSFFFQFLAPMVKFLRENLEKSGCAIGDKFIKAIYCNTKVSGGYARGEGVRICFFYQMNLLWSIQIVQILKSNTSSDLRFQFAS